MYGPQQMALVMLLYAVAPMFAFGSLLGAIGLHADAAAALADELPYSFAMWWLGGMKGVGIWFALAAPKAVPSPIVQKLRAAVLAAMELPSVVERARQVGTDLVPPDERSSEYLQKYFESEIAKWGDVVKKSGAHR